MTETKDIHYWHSFRVRDADVMIAFLQAIGFREHAIYRDEEDPAVVHHAEFVWEGGGGVMFGTVRNAPGPRDGASSAYLVTSDPDALFDTALAAGATVLRPMVEEDYGGRGGTVADPEGNQWSFGNYQPS